MKLKNLRFALICCAIVALVSSCDFLMSFLGMSQDLTFEINLNKSIYEYDEIIDISLDIKSDPNKDITVNWKINGMDPDFSIPDTKSFSFRLKPEINTSYTLEATVSDGKDTIKKTCTFKVKQFALVGTWKAINELNPAYALRKDIVGIWRIGEFEIYYFDANGGTQIRTYSARGVMEFPTENMWAKLTQEEYYDQNTATWKVGSDDMWVRYLLSEDKQSVTIELDMTSPANTAGYTWVFSKVGDSIDSWY
jgi:hypothetical protein